MFVINASTPSCHDGFEPVRQLQASIEATSPFAPASWTCPQCSEHNLVANKHCSRQSCTHELTNTSPAAVVHDQRGRPLEPSRFPAHWICSTCYATHALLGLLLRRPACPCGMPALQAVYDQFGDLFLFWQHDAAIRDLRDPAAAAEAARRLWLAGGERWVDEMPVIRLQDKEEVGEVEETVMSSSSGMSVLVDITA